ncbi:hypothetical protein CLV68_6524 [Actinokineospora cianjurensis]|uniref:Secreted protein n=1 Tax=Actinokineospora cianjurensis TaxID=585224 RepID=A0A421AVU6_9PSEU|nr:hypothetical protein CLV68_6524 [Actinokineospora cianjurensis]
MTSRAGTTPARLRWITVAMAAIRWIGPLSSDCAASTSAITRARRNASSSGGAPSAIRSQASTSRSHISRSHESRDGWLSETASAEATRAPVPSQATGSSGQPRASSDHSEATS